MQTGFSWTGRLILAGVFLSLVSCGGYNRQVADYYENLRQGNYARAEKAIDNNRLLKKRRNRLLFLLERGKLCHLRQQYDSSNRYFNEADLLMENGRTSMSDLLLGTVLNPMMQTYQGEDFEKYLVHYYKAINYLQLGQPGEALVEARRISLRTYAQEDKTANRNRYSDDAFSCQLQGIIYERNGDINNAFIAYRNAADLFIEKKGSYYGVPMPMQLQQDVLRTAALNGFPDEVSRYEQIFNTTYQPAPASEGGELILFWENGRAPVRVQQDIYFSLVKGTDGLFFSDGAEWAHVPFDNRYADDLSRSNWQDFRGFHVALPRYRAQPLLYAKARLACGTGERELELAENINELAFATLQEKTLRELSTALTRTLVKKLAEEALRPAGKKETDSKNEQKKKETRAAMAAGLQLFNMLSEKADTRNWQSLPHSIHYIRVPLQRGENQLTLRLEGGASKSIQLSVKGTGALQIRNLSTFQ